MDIVGNNAIRNNDSTSLFRRINIKKLDLLLRERMFKLVNPKVKYFLRDYVRGDLEVVDYNRLSIFRNLNVKSSNSKLLNVKLFLTISGVQQGIVSELSEYILFNHENLEIRSSVLTRKELKVLLTEKKIAYLIVRNLTIVDDQSIELQKEEVFGLMLKSISNTSDRVYFSFDHSVIPPNWLQMMYDSGCKFAIIGMVSANSEENELIDSELLHKFILTQKSGFEFAFYANEFNLDRFFDHEFSNYFKKVDEHYGYGINMRHRLVYVDRKHKYVFFELK